jgi:hypothetical protein
MKKGPNWPFWIVVVMCAVSQFTAYKEHSRRMEERAEFAAQFQNYVENQELWQINLHNAGWWQGADAVMSNCSDEQVVPILQQFQRDSTQTAINLGFK